MNGFDFTSQDALYNYTEALTSPEQQVQQQYQQHRQQDASQHPHQSPSQPPTLYTQFPSSGTLGHWNPLTLHATHQQEAAVMSQQQQQQQAYQQHLTSQPQPHPAQTVYFAQQIAQQIQHQQPQTQQQQQQQQHNPAHSQSESHGRTHQNMNMAGPGLDMFGMDLVSETWPFQVPPAAMQQHVPHHQQHQVSPQLNMLVGNGLDLNAFTAAPAFASQLQTSPINFHPVTSAQGFLNAAATSGNFIVSSGMDSAGFLSMAGPMESMNALAYPLNEYTFPVGVNQDALTHHVLSQQVAESAVSSSVGGSPTGTALEVQSLSDNEGSWSMVNFKAHRQSLDSIGTVSNPSQNLHIRSNSDSSCSDGPHSAELSGSYEEIHPWPLSSPHDFQHGSEYMDLQHLHGMQMAGQQGSASHSCAVSPTTGNSLPCTSAVSSSTSPSSSGPSSPPLRRRKSPSQGKITKSIVTKKTSPPIIRKNSDGSEKKVGRRRGPLRPEQRQQAHEIRKLRACLRCKFLKKTCDKGEPCAGCRPSHARLWQVPCTRMDIKDIAYFMKDWTMDYKRHASLEKSVINIKDYSNMERVLYITHGYGHYLPISAREVILRNDDCLEVDWSETCNSVNPEEFDIATAKLAIGREGVSSSLLSSYIDEHLDENFEDFVDKLFEGTKFLTEMLKTAYRYYQKEQTESIRKVLKLVIAYNLTTHITTVEGIPQEEDFPGKIDDPRSNRVGQIVAPVMINFEIKAALAVMWRELQRDVLEELSSLYSSVYSGDKLKNWPTIFMLAAILLAVWEELQFDTHYREPNEAVVNKFCEDMENTPVGVIIGLFQAISTKLPGLQEWDTRKHHHLLNSNSAVCDALTEVRSHINKHEKYLKERSNAKFDYEDYDCLSNKFLSRLVIRAN